MKKRLQKLWDEVTPDGGSCPQPDVKEVRSRVDAALDGGPRTVSRRTLRLSIAAAAAVLLLTGTALAGRELIPPEFNVLSSNFFWGENPNAAIAMMSIAPVSVEDGNYVMTVTSSLADGNELYFTLVIEPKNDAARERLQSTDLGELLSYRIPGSSSRGSSGEYDTETGALLLDISANWKAGKSAGARLNLMDEGVWLNFPVKPVRSVTLKVGAEAETIGGVSHGSGGTVTVNRVEMSPLSFSVEYDAPQLDTFPLFCFLLKDGSVKTMGQLKLVGPSGGSRSGLFGQHPNRYKSTWQFGSVQDMSLMEAVVLGGMAYPVDGSEPYEADTSGLPLPFVIPVGEKTSGGGWYVPLFALCGGLGADCRWDEAAGAAAASFRDTTLTFTVGSKTAAVDGAWSWNSSEGGAAAVYRDGELWVDAAPLLRTAWSIEIDPDWGNYQKAEDGSVTFTSWIVNP